MRFTQILIASLSVIGLSAQAETVTARVVADDHYSVFVGNASASSMTLVGDSGTNLWMSQGAPFSFSAAAGDYIYVAAWDDANYGAPHMWIGTFTAGSTTLYSNTTDWTTKYDNTIKSPGVAQVSALVQSAAPWLAPLVSMPNGSSPYGSLIGAAPASMVWHDTFNGSSASENGYALFRSLAPIVAVPESSTYALLTAGLLVVGCATRSRA